MAQDSGEYGLQATDVTSCIPGFGFAASAFGRCAYLYGGAYYSLVSNNYNNGGYAGLSYLNLNNAVSNTNANIGASNSYRFSFELSEIFEQYLGRP